VNLGSTVNSASWETGPDISEDGLTLFLQSNRSGGQGSQDLWVTTRTSIIDPWDPPLNLGSLVNSTGDEVGPSISSDGCTLFFSSNRSGGYGGDDLYVSTRPTVSDDWEAPLNLGPTINTVNTDRAPSISSDGRMLFFHSNRPGGNGIYDLYVTMRSSVTDTWGTPTNLGSTVNSSVEDVGPSISDDGKTLFFMSMRSGGFGSFDAWQVLIEPVVDLNADGIVNADDMCIIVDNWGTNEPLCDIGPMPWGDGIVDVEDLKVLAEHLFEEIPPAE
jgi:Tol biopolymer transport system component